MSHLRPVDPSRPSPGDAPVVIYGYVPAIQLCSIGVLTFLIALIAHLIRAFRTQSWFMLPCALACFAEILGYVFRSLSSQKDPYRISWFVAQYFLITTAPILITASMYICLTRILSVMEAAGAPAQTLLRIVSRKAILWTFIAADVITTIVQIAGSALIGVSTSRHENPAQANNVVLAGIAIQTFFFCIYYAMLSSAALSIRKHKQILERSFVAIVSPLWIASAMVILRLIFRLAESGDGVFGFVWTHEALFGTLEFLPVLGSMIILAIWHPGRSLSRAMIGARQSAKTTEIALPSLA